MADSLLQPKQVRLGEVDYAYSEGPANGPKLVLMHGVTGSRESWDPVLPHLIDSFQLYTVDHRGHGRSSHHPGRYHIDYMVDDLNRFIETLTRDPVFLVGHSMGARIALKFAASHPDRVRSVVLEDPPLGYGPAVLAIREFFEFLLKIKRQGLSENELCREIAAYNGSDDSEAFRYKARTLCQMDGEVIERLLEKQLWPGDQWNRQMSEVKCPAFLLQADTECGGVMDEDLSQVAELKAANWQWKRYTGIGHSIHAEATEAFSKAVESFLRGIGT